MSQSTLFNACRDSIHLEGHVLEFISYHSYKLQRCMLPDKRCLSHGMCLYQVMMTLHFLNDVANDDESTQKIDHYIIFTSLKNESTW